VQRDKKNKKPCGSLGSDTPQINFFLLAVRASQAHD